MTRGTPYRLSVDGLFARMIQRHGLSPRDHLDAVNQANGDIIRHEPDPLRPEQGE